MTKSQNIVVLTGAGISAESGIRTFRDTGGLWENHSIEEVATPEGYQRNPKLVLDLFAVAHTSTHTQSTQGPGTHSRECTHTLSSSKREKGEGDGMMLAFSNLFFPFSL